MTTLVSERSDEPWRRRLYLPNYQIGEAAKYADISPQTVAAWHKKINDALLSQKEQRAELSYLQLIEVAVVAAFRKAGVKLPDIRAARDYAQRTLRSEYPFAQYRFKTEGKNLWLDYGELEGEDGRGTLVKASQAGQLAWKDIIGRLKEFEYEHEGVVIRWHVAGASSPIIIDPRISFGAPTVGGIPTWIIKGRWNAGESDTDIAEDFGLEKEQVRKALDFEGVGSRKGKAKSRTH
jgi:uncharacterized protein (DUF433 family)/DNA-binding transcriptional MerR regulator